MTRKIIALIGLALLAGCSGGGGDSATPSSAPAPLAQPDILTATDQGLQRGKANGEEQRLVFARPDLDFLFMALSHGHVFYAQDFDIWAVRTDGTEARQIVGTHNIGGIEATNGPWLILRTQAVQPSGSIVDDLRSLDFETGTQFQLDDPGGTQFRAQNERRLISFSDKQISSITNMGTDRLTYDKRTGPGGVFFSPLQIVDNMLIYSRDTQTFMIPLGGGTARLLDEARYDTYSAWSIGDRLIYHRRLSSGPPEADVVSIRTNGTDRIVLTTHPANEAVQGTVGNLVLIRRNLTGHDELFTVPVTGGPERLLMTGLTDSDHIILTTDTHAIVGRPTGVWTVDMGGTLNQISEIDTHFVAMIVGNALCFNHAGAAYCAPLDGSSPAVKIANEGKVVGVL